MKINGKVVGNPMTTPMKGSDWNQNDERKADYIKNRTHYEGDISICDTIVAEAWQNLKLSAPFDWNNAKILVDGKEVEYLIGDNRYSEGLVMVYDANSNQILHYYDADMKPLVITALDLLVGKRVQIIQSCVKTLDEKYIPDNIARVGDVERMIGIVNDELESILAGGVD